MSTGVGTPAGAPGTAGTGDGVTCAVAVAPAGATDAWVAAGMATGVRATTAAVRAVPT